MQIVKMMGVGDCGAACLAMALGFRKASDVYPILGYDPSVAQPMGVSDVEVIAALENFGRKTQYAHPRELTSESWGVPMESLECRVLLPTKKSLQSRLGSMQNGCAIVAVPSLNMSDSEHYVFCYRGEVYDPSNRKAYHGAASSLPLTQVIFIERNPG